MAKDNADRPGFDIYGMLTIVTFLLMGGACYLLFDDLNSNWGFVMFGDKPSAKRATHLTEYRDIGKISPYVIVRQEDRDDWDAIPESIKGGKDFPVKDYEWPKGYDPVKFPVQPSVNNWAKTQDSQDGDKWKAAFEALLSAADKEAAPDASKTPDKTAPEKAPDATKPDDAAPKKDDAAAPKKDDAAAPKTDAATKKDDAVK